MQKVNDKEVASRDWQLASMTGFGRAIFLEANSSLEVVISSVNHRGIDVKCHMCDGLRFLEQEISALVLRSFGRGRFSVSLDLKNLVRKNENLAVDEERLENLLSRMSTMQNRFPALVMSLTMGDILSVPGIITETEQKIDEEKLRVLVKKTVGEALVDLAKSRAMEGSILQASLKRMLVRAYDLVVAIQGMAQKDIEKRFERLKMRLRDLVGTLDLNEDRIYQEFALLVERSDFTEEIDRLLAHVVHFDGLGQEAAGAKGRKLDFLCQEMLRETNTLMSKAFDQAVTVLAIDLKAEVERIREHVQNIE